MSPKKRYKRPERPKLRRARRQEQWIVLSPPRLAALGGAAAAFLMLLTGFLRQLFGAAVDPQSMLLGAALVFVVAYTLVGAFVWYLLAIAERELPIAKEDHRAHRLEGQYGDGGGKAAPAQPTTPAAEPPQEGTVS